MVGALRVGDRVRAVRSAPRARPFEPFKVHCDFCPVIFTPEHEASRTCKKCRKKGAPDQSLDEDYDKRLIVWFAARGKRLHGGRKAA